MKTIILAALLCFSFNCFADDEWTKADSYREATYLTFLAVDWAQTRYIARYKQCSDVTKDKVTTTTCHYFREINPILGTRPSVDRVDVYFILSGAAHMYVSRILSEKWRARFQYVTIGYEVIGDASNYHFGIKMEF